MLYWIVQLREHEMSVWSIQPSHWQHSTVG